MRLHNKIILCCAVLFAISCGSVRAAGLYSLRNIVGGKSVVYERCFSESDFGEYVGTTGAAYVTEDYGDATAIAVGDSYMRMTAGEGSLVSVSEGVSLPDRYCINFRCKSNRTMAYVGIGNGRYRFSLSINGGYLSVAGQNGYTRLWDRYDELGHRRNLWYEYIAAVDGGRADIYRKAELDSRYEKILSGIKLCETEDGTLDVYVIGAERTTDFCLDFIRVYADKKVFALNDAALVTDGESLNYEFDVSYDYDGIHNCRVFAAEIDLLCDDGNSVYKIIRTGSLWADGSRKIVGSIDAKQLRNVGRARFTVKSGDEVYSRVAYIDEEEM